MGSVYRGRHLRLDKPRAIKLLPPDLAANADFRSRFEREWRAAAEIDHPNIVEVLDAGEQDGRLYIVMRYVDGVDLHKLIAAEGPLDPARTVAVLGPVADALDAAHERGLIHRDVKPSNILLARDGTPYLSDFGIAKSSSTRGLTKTGLFVGTVDYAAPEQIESRPLDRRTDVYALGGVLYSCLTGAPPYERDTDLQVMLAQLNDPVPAPSERRAGLPSGLDDVVGRAMAKAMDERHDTCGAVVRDAERTLRVAETRPAGADVETKLDGSLPTELAAVAATELGRPAAPEPIPEPDPERPRRRGLLLAVAGGIVLLAAAAVAAAIALGGDSDTVDASGRVLDARSGAPLADVSVQAADTVVPTARDGSFTLDALPRDATLAFTSCAHESTQVPADSELVVRLTPVPVEGVVTSALTGRPLAATVREGERSTRTNAAGRYSLYGSCPGGRARVSAPGFLTQTVAIGADRRASAVLKAPKSVRETFSNVRNWFAGSGGSAGEGDWNAFVANGAYHVRVTAPDITSGAIGADFDPVTKFKTIEQSQVKPANIRVAVESTKVTGGDANTAAGVACNTPADLSYEFIVGSDGYYRLDRRPRPSARLVEVVGWRQSAAIRGGAATNDLSVICRGGASARLRLVVNGRTLIDVRDPVRVPGFQSIYLFAASYDAAPIEVAFDNLVFTRG